MSSSVQWPHHAQKILLCVAPPQDQASQTPTRRGPIVSRGTKDNWWLLGPAQSASSRGLAPDRLPQVLVDGLIPMHILDSLRGPMGLKPNEQKDHMKLGGKRGEGYGKSWMGKVEGRLDQNTIYTCMKFSNHKLKIRKEKVYCNLITVCTYSMSKLLAYNFFLLVPLELCEIQWCVLWLEHQQLEEAVGTSARAATFFLKKQNKTNRQMEPNRLAHKLICCRLGLILTHFGAEKAQFIAHLWLGQLQSSRVFNN